MNYKMLGGGTIYAPTNLDLVINLRKNSFNPGESLEEFMEQTAKACKLQNTSIIRTDNIDVFVEDLIENNFLTKVD